MGPSVGQALQRAQENPRGFVHAAKGSTNEGAASFKQNHATRVTHVRVAACDMFLAEVSSVGWY